jgi:hypothetical protein
MLEQNFRIFFEASCKVGPLCLCELLQKAKMFSSIIEGIDEGLIDALASSV